jgi:hypothetical protein
MNIVDGKIWLCYLVVVKYKNMVTIQRVVFVTKN